MDTISLSTSSSSSSTSSISVDQIDISRLDSPARRDNINLSPITRVENHVVCVTGATTPQWQSLDDDL